MGATVGVANEFFAGSLVSVVVVVPVVGFGCAGTAEVGVNELGVVALVIEVVVTSLGGIATAGEGFFCSVPFWSWNFCLIFDIASASISCFSHFENDLTCCNRGESKPTAAGL